MMITFFSSRSCHIQKFQIEATGLIDWLSLKPIRGQKNYSSFFDLKLWDVSPLQPNISFEIITVNIVEYC